MLDDTDYAEAKPFLDQDQLAPPRHSSSHKHRGWCFILLPWVISAISWIVMIYLLLTRPTPISQAVRSKENTTSLGESESRGTYFPTDFEALRSSIVYETRTFTGALLYDEAAQRFFRNISDEESAYVGPPSAAIDAAWELLLDKEWTPMTESEAAPFRPEFKHFNDQYFFETDMFHSLHCLNEVRKRVDIDYYSQPEHAGFKIDQEDWERIHIDHCLDQLRQTIMCAGDLSPVPLYSWEGAPLGIGRGSQHTCRKWEPIRQWVDQRHLEMQGS